MSTIDFTIITPQKVTYKDTISSVSLDTLAGRITVLPEHTPLLSVLKGGEMIIRRDNKEEILAVHGGFIEVQKGSVVRILADGAERVEEIDEQRAKEAVERAKKLKKEKTSMSDMEYARIAAKLERDLARLRIVKRHRR